MRFYLDDNLPVTIVAAARRLGVDVLCSRDEGCNGTSDEEQLRYATSIGRCIVTRDERDVRLLTAQFALRGEPHSGVLLLPPSIPDGAIGRITQALATLSERYPDDAPEYFPEFLKLKSS